MQPAPGHSAPRAPAALGAPDAGTYFPREPGFVEWGPSVALSFQGLPVQYPLAQCAPRGAHNPQLSELSLFSVVMSFTTFRHKALTPTPCPSCFRGRAHGWWPEQPPHPTPFCPKAGRFFKNCHFSECGLLWLIPRDLRLRVLTVLPSCSLVFLWRRFDDCTCHGWNSEPCRSKCSVSGSSFHFIRYVFP